ncbi:hypothetical protein Pla52n_50670 [Stieleria varia]|uniref:Uncharacterized protein n=1 Tax=Stieleria varia TaxID=2528005 RepID=A0A5C6AHP4_9BACT|nr:hypothetical protein Pla52n_50670 [Stieleria varia]
MCRHRELGFHVKLLTTDAPDHRIEIPLLQASGRNAIRVMTLGLQKGVVNGVEF